MYKNLSVLLFLTFISAALSDNVYSKCGDRLQCVEEELVRYVDGLDQEETVKIFGDFVVLEKSGSSTPRKDSEGFLERCARYLATHELKIKLPNEEVSGRSMAAAEARSKKLRKIILPLLLLLKLKAAIVIPAVLALVALVAFNGLGAGMTALAISGAVGLKSLLDNHHHGSKLTYEVVPQIAPHWSRSGIDNSLPQGYHTIP